MIIAVDVETQGLDCTKFVCGCLMKENSEKHEMYYTKESLWNRIKELGQSELNRGKMLNVYSHNAIYDFYAYAPLDDPNIKWFSTTPFICSYKINERESIKFLDTMALFKGSLKKLGNAIVLEKLEMPKELYKKETKITKELLREIEPYVKRDTEICLNSVLLFKELLKKEGIHVKRLYTINQIAINFLINKWRKLPNNDYIFWDKESGETRRTFRSKEIHGAYRGGRVEAFKTGYHGKVTYIDCNSLYPFAACNMRFPDLRTERKTKEPLKETTLKELLKKIGISRCLIENQTNNLGLLTIRTQTANYFPKAERLLIGTWTHQELAEAIKEGYKIKNIEWSVTWEDAPENPFKELFTMLYKKKNTDNQFERYFYKMMMNACIGKLAQTRTGQEIVIDSVDKADEYLKQKWAIEKGLELNLMYSKPQKEYRKKYYTPIVPTLINAWARVFMYQQMKKIPLKDLIYTDTDSVLFLNKKNKEKFKLGTDMGEFKIEYEDMEYRSYGRKTYRIGDEIKASGIHPANLNKEDFDKGHGTDNKMITLKTTPYIEEVGTFREEKRDFNEQLRNYNELMKKYDGEKLLIDCDILDINYFLDKLN